MARTSLVRRGAFSVRCAIRGPRARRCVVTLLAGRRVIGIGSSRTAGGTVSVRVQLTPAGRRLLARVRRGLTARVMATASYADGATRRSTALTRLRGS